MRDRDRRQAALGRDALDDLVVEVGGAVPEHVAGVALDEERALADREATACSRCRGCRGRRGCSASCPSRNSLERQPDLARVVRDVLARVLADRAGAGRLVARRVLRAAGLTQIRRHRRVRAARRTRRAACAGTCRPGARARGGSRSRRRGASRRRRASSGCTRRRRSRGAPSSPRRFSALPGEARRAAGRRRRRPGRRRASRRSRSTSPTLPAKKARVADRVQLRVLDRARDRLLGDLDPPHRHRVARHREADRADAAVEVVDGLAAGQPGVLARELVQPLGHRGVRLQERVRAHAEAQAADLLLDRVLAPEELGRQVRHLGAARR